MEKKYFSEIDILKGLGIFLVVIGHTSIGQPYSKLIFSFHMPLFFFVSGFVFKKGDNKDFIVKKFKRIMVPFYLFSLISFLFYFLSIRGKGEYGILDFITKTIYAVDIPWNIVLWFLPAIFSINVIVNFVYNFTSNKQQATSNKRQAL